ncbi:M28 family metallopeptidase [Aureitalea marina]|uniref:Peptidase M28 n=1 Tax=Aureitalea marina TaxID=930804 RepID=A0A2S7KN96_9FLAO|nr:M28 family metallopeptidase [Aureitalea marina]PQB04104.1 peptidase M28 [Aureitalea marina]
MYKGFLITAMTVTFISCNSAQTASSSKTMDRTDYANTITAEEMKELLYVFASDEMQGRMTGSEGQKKAAKFLTDFYQAQDIPGGMTDGTYYQPIPASYFKRRKEPKPSENVLAFIKGSEKPDEVIVISAHYDHVGMDNDGNVYNGADDDGSGTISLLEIAQAFQMAVKNGNGPKRSILFLHVTGEEIGLYGSRYYTENPIYPLANTVCNLNSDMVGRIDPDKADSPNYIYLIGSDKLSQELHELSEAVNTQYTQLELDYTYNDENDPNRFYYRSDHYNFAKHNIPIIFYFNGVHEDYHKITDTPDKIEYDLMAKRAQLIFHTAWEVANKDGRITADKVEAAGSK